MKKFCAALFFAAILFADFSYAQTPGGVAPGPRLWLKANSGVTVSPAGLATQWDDLSGAGITGNFTTANSQLATPVQPPTYQAAGINFNPHIAFNSTVPNSLVSANAFPGTSLLDLNANTVLQVIKLHTMTGTGVWLKWQFTNTSPYRLGNEVNPGSNGGRLRFDFPTGGNLLSTTSIFDKYTLVNLATSPQKSIRFDGAQDAVNTVPTTNTTLGTASGRVSLGNEYIGDPYPTTIDMAEVIVFNRTLTATERNKLESYLAIKYGFTLSQAVGAANDYTSSTGAVLWSGVGDSGYAKNITGIGRDDASGLSQLQSRSIHSGALVTLYHGAYTGATVPQLNTGNTNPFVADNSFVLVGDNGFDTELTTCFAGPPAGFRRMNRVWKVRETGGSTGTVTIAVNATDVPAATKHLMVSGNPAFPTASTTVYRLDNSGGVLSATVPSLADGSYFTFASDSLIAHATTNSPVCAGTVVQLFGNNGGGTYNWTGPQGFSSTDQNPIIPNATADASGTYTLGGVQNGCPLFPASTEVTVFPNPPVAFTVSQDVCEGAPLDVQMTTPTAGIISFNWNFDGGIVTNGATGEGPYQLTYDAEGVKNISLTSEATGCPPQTTTVSTTIRPLPKPKLVLSASNVCFGDSILVYTAQQDIDAIYSWTPNSFFGYSSPYAPQQVVVPSETGLIKVETVTPFGCEGADSVLVQVEICCTVSMPTAFTPNSDGRNDYFRPVSQDRYVITDFRIFNRWGQQVYINRGGLEKGWDGTWQGERQESGVYHYLLNFDCKGGKYTTQKGDITLIR